MVVDSSLILLLVEILTMLDKADIEVLLVLAKIGFCNQVATPPRKRDPDLKPWDCERYTAAIDKLESLS